MKIFLWGLCPGLGSSHTMYIFAFFQMSVELTQFILRSFQSDYCYSEQGLTFIFSILSSHDGGPSSVTGLIPLCQMYAAEKGDTPAAGGAERKEGDENILIPF